MSDTENKAVLPRSHPPHEQRPYYILSLLQERELLRARVQADSTALEECYSSAASTMAAALIEEVLDVLEEDQCAIQQTTDRRLRHDSR